jgi:hypothetical protein
MEWLLPPPDPNERIGEPPMDLELAAPAVWFPLGAPSPSARRLADEILGVRPGALVVFDTPQ